MKIYKFSELKVWQKSYNLVLEIYKYSKSFPQDEKFGLTNQIRRSSNSICANIAEGFKKSSRDFARYLKIAEGSLEETKYHLMLSKDLGYLKEIEFNELLELSNEIGKMINGLSRKLR